MNENIKQIYVTIGTGNNADPYVKIGDTICIDVNDRDTYVEENLFTKWEAINVNNVRYRDYDLHKFIDANYAYALNRLTTSEKGKEKYFINKNSSLYTLWETRNRWKNNDVALNDLDNLISEIRIRFNTGIANRCQDFPLRNEQKACVEQACNVFNSGLKKFLINAKMRFGKTFTSYNIALGMNAKNVLILTYKPAAKSSWKDDLKNHVAFDNCEFYDYKDDNQPVFNANKMNVFFVSFQALLCDLQEQSGKYSWMSILNWDLIIIDEIHYGDTDKAKNILSSLIHQYELHLSGTPFKQLLLGDFTSKNTFTWTYVDEQRAKELEALTLSPDYSPSKTMYQMLPNMKMIGIEPDWSDSDLKRIKTQYSDDEMQTLTKVFATKLNGDFDHPGAVNSLIDTFFSKVFNSDVIEDASSLNHIFMTIPSVAAGHALAKLLRSRIEISSKEYEIIDACGSGSDVEDDIEGAKNKIMSSKRSITISCGRFTEAVTVPQWGMVVMMNDIKSPSLYAQTIFRSQSPEKRQSGIKKECYVVDFSINRLLSAVYSYVCASLNGEKSLEESFREFLKYAPIYNFSHNSVVAIPMDNFNEIYVKAQDATLSGVPFNGNTVRVPSKIDDNATSILMSIDGNESFSKRFEVVIKESEKYKNGKSFKIDRSIKEKFEEKIQDVTLQQLINAARYVEMKLPNFMEVSENVEYCLNDILKFHDDETDKLFKKITSISREDFKRLVDAGFYDVGALNDRIMYYVDNELLTIAEMS